MNTIFNLETNESKIDISDFKYQEKLTNKLDEISTDFNQEIINEIILWKVNRYAELEDTTLSLLNKIQKKEIELDENLTREVLLALLNTKGIRIAMASTILRFKNPSIYQIVDQRVYRYISKNCEELNDNIKIEDQITLYIDYLIRLRNICKQYNIQFEESDRILYLMDKKFNKGNNLKESKK